MTFRFQIINRTNFVGLISLGQCSSGHPGSSLRERGAKKRSTLRVEG